MTGARLALTSLFVITIVALALPLQPGWRLIGLIAAFLALMWCARD